MIAFFAVWAVAATVVAVVACLAVNSLSAELDDARAIKPGAVSLAAKWRQAEERALAADDERTTAVALAAEHSRRRGEAEAEADHWRTAYDTLWCRWQKHVKEQTAALEVSRVPSDADVLPEDAA